jgi:hypothetical protein
MKKAMLLFCLSMIASAQVLVKQSVNENPATGVKIVTVLLTVKGDKPYNRVSVQRTQGDQARAANQRAGVSD